MIVLKKKILFVLLLFVVIFLFVINSFIFKEGHFKYKFKKNLSVVFNRIKNRY